MQVKKSDLLNLYDALGVESAHTWDDTKLVKRTTEAPGIARYREAGQVIKDDAASKLFDALDAAIKNKEPIEVIELAPTHGSDKKTPEEEPKRMAAPVKKPPAKKAAPTTKKPPKAPAKKAAPKKAPVKASKPVKSTKAPKKKPYRTRKQWQEQFKKWEKEPAQLKKKDGVFGTIVEELKAAGKQKVPGVTKEHILGVLKAKFTDRKEEQMRTSINNMVPSRLKYMFGIHVWKGKNADNVTTYYIVGDGKKPQPEKKEEKKPAKKTPQKA